MLGVNGLPMHNPSIIRSQEEFATSRSELEERNQRFARLVAGAEGSAGETPPPYAAAMEA